MIAHNSLFCNNWFISSWADFRHIFVTTHKHPAQQHKRPDEVLPYASQHSLPPIGEISQ